MNKKWIVLALWAVMVGIGLHYLWSYENKAAPVIEAARMMPTGNTVKLSTTVPTVVMFAHPHCPCSRASIAQLERLLGIFSKKLAVHIFFYQPATKDDSWGDSALWRNAKSLPSTYAERDPDGLQAKLFGATTSGEVFVYSPQGEMLFHGGLTPSRGHEGDSVGTESLAEIGRQGRSTLREAQVFGCTLFQDTKETLGGS